MKNIIAVLSLSCIFISGCSLFQRDAVTVKAERPKLHITNTSDETVSYVVYPAHVLAYVTIVPTCTGRESA